MPDTTPENKGRALLEYQETEKLIGELEEKKRALVIVFADFTDRLQRSPETRLWKPGQPTHNTTVDQYDVTKLPKIEPYAAFDLADKMREAQDKLRRLEEEKRALGLY